MQKFLSLLAFLCLYVSTALASVAISGKARDSKGVVIAHARLIVTAINCVTANTLTPQTLIAAADGTVSGSILSYTELGCTSSAYYNITASTADGTLISSRNYVVTAATFNIETSPQMASIPSALGGSGASGAPGLSTYQIALQNGYSGTQIQWLASLVGPAVSVQVGTVIKGLATDPLTVTNTGSGPNAIFNFKIPLGNATQIAGNNVSANAPVSKSTLIWDRFTNTYDVRPLSVDDLALAFAITSFSCSKCANYELGYSVLAPTTFAASYSAVASSASVTDGTNSAILSAPFTSGSLNNAYASSTPGCQSFSLTATASTTQTSSQSMCWYPLTFGGVGTSGASSAASATGAQATLIGATGTLFSAGLKDQGSYGPYSPANQKIYLLLVGGNHTFTSAGIVFPMNPPTPISFTNEYGATVTMYLYETTNSLNSSFSVTVAN